MAFTLTINEILALEGLKLDQEVADNTEYFNKFLNGNIGIMFPLEWRTAKENVLDFVNPITYRTLIKLNMIMDAEYEDMMAVMQSTIEKIRACNESESPAPTELLIFAADMEQALIDYIKQYGFQAIEGGK
jgi:hypothetical protein